MKDLLKRYSIFELIKLSYYLVRTKLLFSKARLIRFPLDLRGKKYITVSNGFTTGKGCRLEAYPFDGNKKVIKIGENVQINDYVHITAMFNVEIGNNVLLASKIYISDCTHGSYNGDDDDSSPLTSPSERKYTFSEVIIEDNVWIGESVSVLPGVKIGRGAIIGANAVVTKSIPANCIAVGNPARVVKKYDLTTKKWKII